MSTECMIQSVGEHMIPKMLFKLLLNKSDEESIVMASQTREYQCKTGMSVVSIDT